MLAFAAPRFGLLTLCLLLFARLAQADPPADSTSKAPPATTTPKGPKSRGDASPATAVETSPHVTRARELFQAERYTEAAEELQRAYAVEPKPVFLFNAGQAYRKAEQRKQALDMYQEYVKVAPEGSLATEARGYITELQAFIKAEASLSDVNLALETEQTQLQQEKQKEQQLELALTKERRRPWYKHPAFIATASIAGFGLVATGLTVLVLGVLGQTQGGTITVMSRGN